MSMLSEIQESLLVEGTSLEFPLLRLRILAGRMGSDVLEDWVRHEIEGYPEGIEVPEYRRTGITYHGTFTDGYNTLNDVPIPNAVIAQYGGKGWLSSEFREGMGVIDAAVSRADTRAQFSIDAANLLLLLQNKVYKNMSCITVRGTFDISAFVKIRSAVRARMLELTIKFETEIPEAKTITLNAVVQALTPDAIAVANNATQAIVHNYNGPVTNISNMGAVRDLKINVAQGNLQNLISELTKGGIPTSEARELAEILAADKPNDDKGQLNERSGKWLAEKLSKAGGIAWGMTKEVLTGIITEAAKKFYGL
jgi:hypothetical protein